MKIIRLHKYKKKIKINIILNTFTVNGPLGNLSFSFDNLTEQSNKTYFLSSMSNIFFTNKIKTLIRSVTIGWYKELKFKGIGYKCFKMGDKIALDVGYSNLITYKPCSTIKIKNFKNKIVLFGINREDLNNVAACLKNYCQPDIYKGKGIWFRNETLKLKKKSRI